VTLRIAFCGPTNPSLPLTISLTFLLTGYKLAFGCGTALLKKNREADEIDQGTVETIKSAIRVGYRHLDTAEMYNTELEVGEAIRESIDEGVVERKDLFVTTKIFGNYTQAQTAIDISLHKLKLDYVDSYVSIAPSHMSVQVVR